MTTTPPHQKEVMEEVNLLVAELAREEAQALDGRGVHSSANYGYPGYAAVVLHRSPGYAANWWVLRLYYT